MQYKGFVVYQRNVCPRPAVLEPCFDVLIQKRHTLPLKQLISKNVLVSFDRKLLMAVYALDLGQNTSGVGLECSRSDFLFKHFDH